MISDVLFEALSEIEVYQREMPDAYKPLGEDIEAVKLAMRSLLRKLDTPPGASHRSCRVREPRNAPSRLYQHPNLDQPVEVTPDLAR